MRLLFYGLTLFLGVVLLLNTSDGQACLESTILESRQIAGVLPINISTAVYLRNSPPVHKARGSRVLSQLGVTKSGTIFQAPKSQCTSECNCVSVYLVQEISSSLYLHMVSFNGTRDKIYKLRKTPVWHAIVEPVEHSVQNSDTIVPFDACSLYGPPGMQMMICGADRFDSGRNEWFLLFGERRCIPRVLIKGTRLCAALPGFQSGGDCKYNFDSWRASQTYSVRVHRRYADVTYRTSGAHSGYTIDDIENVSSETRSQYVPTTKQLAMYDSILPHANASRWTSEWSGSTSALNLNRAMNYAMNGGNWEVAGLATLLWRLPLNTEISEKLVQDHNINATECETIDQIQLSFHSFYFFSAFCGTILATCLIIVAIVTRCRTPAVAQEFPEIGFVMELCSEKNNEALKGASRLFGGIKKPGILSKTITIFETIEIKLIDDLR